MPTGGTITGTVRDKASNVPIAGATVITRRVVGGTFSGDFSTSTDANGNYTLTGLHTGEYLMSAQAAGRVFVWYGGDPNTAATDYSSSTPVQVTAPGTVANISMNLTIGGGLIQGRVTRSDEGQPVVGAFVAIRGPFPRTTSVSPASVQTNAQGDFSFPGLPPGRYTVEADRIQAVNGTAIGFYPFPAIARNTGVPVTVTDGGVFTTDFQVLGFSNGATPRSIRGTKTNSASRTISNWSPSNG